MDRKVKVKSLCCFFFFNWAPRFEGVLGIGGIAPHIFDLGTRWTRWKWVVSFTPRPLYSRKRALGTHCVGNWVGLRAGLHAVVKRNEWLLFIKLDYVHHLYSIKCRPLGKESSMGNEASQVTSDLLSFGNAVHLCVFLSTNLQSVRNEDNTDSVLENSYFQVQ
jgi:hypothetical protein